MTTDPMLLLIWHTFLSSAAGVALLQWLKKAKWFPWLQQVGTTLPNRIGAILVAIAGVTGIHYVYDPVGHSLLIPNFTWAAIGAGLWHWAQQFIMQEFVYQATSNKTAVTPVSGK